MGLWAEVAFGGPERSAELKKQSGITASFPQAGPLPSVKSADSAFSISEFGFKSLGVALAA
jgi:hypothetical protein